MIRKLSEAIINELEELKAEDIRIHDVTGRSSLADIIIIAGVDNPLTLEAARTRIIDLMRENKWRLKNPTEEWRGGWLIMDYGDIIVNVFLDEMRRFYDLDGLLESGKFDLDEINHVRAK